MTTLATPDQGKLAYQHQIIDFIWNTAQNISQIQAATRVSPHALTDMQNLLNGQVRALNDLADANAPMISGYPSPREMSEHGAPLLSMIADADPTVENQLYFNRYYADWNMDVCGYVRRFRELYAY